ncbi:MAG: tetratricopeptide repeat protein [Bacteroidales bacterium]|nr:tetratricopeptide repeat protein [Bacteroidales bacterium]
MRRLKLLIIILIATTSIFAQKENLLSTFEQANIEYADENFEQAINKYESVVEKKYESAELYYNLGNAFFKQNNIPKAIVNYERAYRLSPNDEDIKHNLEHANLFVQDEFTKVPDFILDRIYHGVVHVLGSNTWALISINTFILGLTVFLIFLFSKIVSRRKLAFFFSILLMMFSIITFSFSAESKKQITEPNAAIIMEISTIKSSPENDGTDLYILNPGVKVGIKSINNDWYEVKLPNGKIGWIQKNVVEII